MSSGAAGARGHLTAGGSGGGAGGGRDPADVRSEVSEQIATALAQLQQDMTSVLSRLNTLEALTVAQTQVFNTLEALTIAHTQVCNT